MLKQIEGSFAVAEAVALCRPEVICAYPITPQTHIVEHLSELVRQGEIGNCQYLNVDSEFSAMGVAIGASATGARTYTATSSQGLLFMAEAVHNAAGLGLPIVMTIGNRAIGAPINIWNDHSDSMALRDAGWIQVHAESNQEAVDLHIQAFRLAEHLSVPVMVCEDGFILTHAVERVDMPEAAQVDAYLPPFEPVQLLDPDEPVTIGAMVGPEAFAEVRYLSHHKQLQAIDVIPELADEFAEIFGRQSGGLVQGYRLEDADTVIVALGSVIGTIKDVVDDMRADGLTAGALKITTFRPFPLLAVREALEGKKCVVVLEKSLEVGLGGIVASDVRMALRGLTTTPVYTVIAGLGGRPITKASLDRVFRQAIAEEIEDPHFLDLDWALVDRELARAKERRRSGPIAENILRQRGLVGGRPH
ncbi:MAG: pyruvate ferredoxin oxidoreductase [Alphaproteobacteria bacterium]|jgi:pyruvate ferredoxin oxidoreductase alpha subunit|nr:pyruvate ferredoxin oxidoreductase [Rhodospirillaceae bacterium]MDP6407252.1 pyruvate ferredoxin oxidoreductase [Alphaproteobacteria bacterium]MDP6624156.1 pyruvate ferredoxin oxidoreductase [Alphaproteobacteria bacterium]